MAVNGLACTAYLSRIIGWHRPSCCFTKTIITLSFIFITLPGFLHPTIAENVSDSVHKNDARRICSSVDIRNSLESFKRLEHCEVIEGFLSILLFDNVEPADLSKISFPKLTEITDYLLLYRVNGLRSVGQLFPNLSVIRGSNSFLNKALVIFEMSTLQEIGLYSLTAIIKGQVHIDKNPSLCFVKTIDWNKIVREHPEKNIVKSLKPDNECPVCPSSVVSGNETIHCPTRDRINSAVPIKEFLCWNKNHCQKECPVGCNSCNNKLVCCKQSCSACRDDDPNICTVCPNISYGFDEQKKCLNKCPEGLYGYLDRRCINRTQCLNAMHKPIELQTTNYYPPEPFKIHLGKCIMECPPNFTEQNSTCISCKGNCKKNCPGINIDSIAMSRQLRGCTHINGSLEIQLRGGANITELEENLNMIEEISGYLKIVRSFSLLSLTFLKNLRMIGGQELENDKYVFIVLDNQNLQDLWGSTNRTMKIKRGKLFFHFNPKLCYDKIVKLQKIAKLDTFTDLEVARNSNGDKIACNIINLNVTITKTESRNVSLHWQAFHLEDPRTLLAYTIVYVEAPHQNISLYDGKDACGQDKWNIIDLPSKEDEKEINYTVGKLNPYTQYAFYVKTYTIAQEKYGAQSKIQYFTTKPSKPMRPIITQVVSYSSDSLNITWRAPSQPNGPITHYKINVTRKREQAATSSADHNYCNDDLPRDDAISTVKPPMLDNCNCDSLNKNILNKTYETEATEAINFEDELINIVYLKRPKRETVTYSNATLQESQRTRFFDQPIVKNVNDTHYFVKDLHHYTAYDIFINTCRYEPENQTVTEECSESAARHTGTTQPKDGADKISHLRISNKNQDSVTISWNQPKDPNGNIFAYIIEYRRSDISRAKPTSECHNVTTSNATLYYTVSKLSAGNYSLYVYAKSLNKKEQSEPISFSIEERSSNTTLIVSIIVFILLIVMIFFCWLYKKHQKDIMYIEPNPEYVPSVYIKDDWEVPRNKILLIKELGQGSFGMVWEGVANDIRGKTEVRCAVKTVNEHATDRERLEFLNEASVMKAFDTTHVVRLLGVVSEGQPTLVIMELMANGDLKSYLRSHRPDMENYNPSLVKHPPTLKQILKMAIEIADGMAYLSEKKYVHRDLAARNCMVSEDLVVKIGDFGMTRDIYETDYYRKGTKGLLPVRWMAPESLKDGVFTSSCDVWSYGVVLWEMATLASQPYQGLSNDQVLRYVIDGGVMERPENCPDKLYTLMRYCWQHKPSSRPSFLKLCQFLLEDASAAFADVSFYHSPAGVEARASRHTPSPSQDDQSTPLRTITERLKGYTPQSQDSDNLDVDTHHHFPSISESGTGVITTANGYLSGCPTNGAATTQC